jgi:multiple sugar transport system substrate-binding protein
MRQPATESAPPRAVGMPMGIGLRRRALLRRAAVSAAAAEGWAWLAACGRSSEQGSSTGRTAKGPVTLTLASPGDAAVQADKWKPLLSAWQQRFPDVQLAQDVFGASMPQYSDRLGVVFAGGGGYDALQMHWTVVGDIMTRGWMQPLDALIARDRSVNLADFPAHIVAAHQWRNKQYGIPFIGNPIVPWFNADLYAGYGVTTPADHVKGNRWTLTQWLDSARATTRGQGDDKTWGYGGGGKGTGVAGVNYWLPVVWSFGGDLWNKDVTALALDSREALAGLDFFANAIVKQEVAPPVSQSASWDETSGKVGMGTYSPYTDFKKYAWQPGMAVNPRGTGGVFHLTGSQSYGICKQTEHTDDAWLWCKWLSDDGVKIWMDLADQTAPQRKSHIEYTGWTRTRKPWETFWPAVLESQRLPVTIPGWTAIFEIFSAEYDQVLAGKMTAQEAVARAKPQIDGKLKSLPRT